MSQQRNPLRLDDARQLTPPPNPVEAMRQQLALAVFDSVKPKDVLEMANKLKEMAQGGDLKAMKMYFELVLGKDAKPAPPPSDAGIVGALRALAEGVRDIVDEVRIAKAAPSKKELKELKMLNGNGKHSEDDKDDD